MGLIRSYTRFSEAELHEIYLQDSTEDVVGFVNDLRDADPTITVDIDKAFEALGLMFDRSGLPVNPVVGQGSMPGEINFSEGILQSAGRFQCPGGRRHNRRPTESVAPRHKRVPPSPQREVKSW